MFFEVLETENLSASALTEKVDFLCLSASLTAKISPRSRERAEERVEWRLVEGVGSLELSIGKESTVRRRDCGTKGGAGGAVGDAAGGEAGWALLVDISCPLWRELLPEPVFCSFVDDVRLVSLVR